ncbi:MAG: HDOD domain-containing protein [Burkholderiales bacterium]|nr:HDOD domain-containing protein [Burkholderiales bacterium]
MLRSGTNQGSSEHLAKWERDQAPSAATVVRLLNMLKSDADLIEVERELKREPVLSYRLLRFVNSASAGFHKSISSFRQAVVILGYHQLHRWLAVLLVTTAKNGERTEVVRSCLVRASFMETLAMGQSITLTLADQCFIVGVFSRLDELLGQPLVSAIAPLNLSSEIRAALLERSGEGGTLLELAIAMEAGNKLHAGELLGKVKVSPLLAEQSYEAALSWADNLPV